MKVIIQDEAGRHLDEGYLWYEQQEPGAGDYFIQRMMAEIDSLPRYADIHRKVFGLHRLGTAAFPFSIYYSVQDGTILVKAILDNRRSPAWIRKQLEG